MTIKDISAVPAECIEYDKESPVCDELGEVTGFVTVKVRPDYAWQVTIGKKEQYVRQGINPFTYESDDEKLDRTPAATLCKVGLKDGAVKYAGESPRSVCNVPKYLLDAWIAAGLLKNATIVEHEVPLK